jgi:hypothetical protein
VAKNDPRLVMTKTVTKVKIAVPGMPGSACYQQDDLDEEHELEVFGTQYVTWGDGSGAGCYLVLNKDFILVPRAMSRFKVVDWNDE